MVDNSRVILENHQEYYVIDKIVVDDKAYVYLANLEDPKDFCCRKEIIENDTTFLVGLDDKEEADMALNIFVEKHNND